MSLTNQVRLKGPIGRWIVHAHVGQRRQQHRHDPLRCAHGAYLDDLDRNGDGTIEPGSAATPMATARSRRPKESTCTTTAGSCSPAISTCSPWPLSTRRAARSDSRPTRTEKSRSRPTVGPVGDQRRRLPRPRQHHDGLRVQRRSVQERLVRRSQRDSTCSPRTHRRQHQRELSQRSLRPQLQPRADGVGHREARSPHDRNARLA